MKIFRSLLLAVLMAAPLFAHAQDAYDGGGPRSNVRLRAGLKLGVNLSQLNSDNWKGGYRANLLGGLCLSLGTGRIGVQVEGLFSQSSYVTGTTFYDGYKAFYNSLADSARQGTFRANYLSIPVLFQARILPRVMLQLGPQYSGVVSVDDRDELLRDAKGLFKTGTIDGVGGLVINLTRHLNAGARYVISFTDLNESNAADKWKARNLQLHVGYTF